MSSLSVGTPPAYQRRRNPRDRVKTTPEPIATVESGTLLRGFTDLHNHILPGVDDGSRDVRETRIALDAMVSNAVRCVVATPHLRASLTREPIGLQQVFARVDEAWGTTAALARAEYSELRLYRGVELLLDVPDPDASDPRVRLAGTSFVLVEFPFLSVPPRSAEVLSRMRGAGYRPIIAHPERYREVDWARLIDAWRASGAVLQVNCGSLMGDYGALEQRRAWALLECGAAHYLASDYHGRGALQVAKCASEIRRRGGSEAVQMLLEENPGRLLRDLRPIDPPPVSPRRSFWKRFWG